MHECVWVWVCVRACAHLHVCSNPGSNKMSANIPWAGRILSELTPLADASNRVCVCVSVCSCVRVCMHIYHIPLGGNCLVLSL